MTADVGHTPTSGDQARGDPVGPEYDALAAFFDDFANEEARWRRRNSGYHAWITSLHRFQIPPGSRVLEIGCGSGDLLAALSPARGVGADISPQMIALARSRHPKLRFGAVAGEQLALDETFDYVVLSDLAAVRPRLGGAVRARPRALPPGHAGHHSLVQPRLAPGDPARRARPAEAREADPQLGRARRDSQPARPHRLRDDHRDAADLASEARSVPPLPLNGLLGTSGRFTISASRGGWSHGRGRSRAASLRFDRVPLPERAG